MHVKYVTYDLNINQITVSCNVCKHFKIYFVTFLHSGVFKIYLFLHLCIDWTDQKLKYLKVAWYPKHSCSIVYQEQLNCCFDGSTWKVWNNYTLDVCPLNCAYEINQLFVIYFLLLLCKYEKMHYLSILLIKVFVMDNKLSTLWYMCSDSWNLRVYVAHSGYDPLSALICNNGQNGRKLVPYN